MKKRKAETALIPTGTSAPAETDEAKNEAPMPADGVRKMSIYEYEQRYVKRENTRGAKLFVRGAAALIGVVLFLLCLHTALRMYEINQVAGYVTGGLLLLVYLLVFVLPLVKLLRTGYFVTNVNAMTARKAQRHNRKLRRDIAGKLIDFSAKVDGAGWYDSLYIGKLAVALSTNDDDGIKQQLTALYKTSVKKSAKGLIMKSSLKSAAYSALSQTAHVDAALVVVVNMQLIKDLVFLYGFRPSDAKLAKIFVGVIRNSLIAYGLGNVNIGSGVVKTMGDAVRGIPILGAAIASLIDSSVQGLTNGALTTVIGYQTIKYLQREYRLQDILDGVSLEDTDAEIGEACAELEKELKSKKKKTAVA